ncbi:MAG TPA: 3-deoxy-manno-octulosonate cytidylyltransferase [Gemmatimonadaceae bacterium]|nr:3-deoxy-manno-octulosonate cytidylyltransferase [Gemmatimonadaceae bacterium]
MTTLAVIPARLGATRLHRKPLRLLGGSPLVVRVWQRVQDLEIADYVVVATDHPDVAAAARDVGAECILTKADHPSGTDRIAEVVARPEFARRQFDVILNVQGDEPFVAAEALTGAIDMVRDRGFPLGTAAIPDDPAILDQPSVVKVVCADDGRALYFSRAAIPFARDRMTNTNGEDMQRVARSMVRRHLGVYAYTPAALAQWVALPPHPLERIERLEQLRPLAAGMAMGVALVNTPPEPSIDTEDDLERANSRWTDFTARHR